MRLPADRSISGFTILEEDGLISLLGIKAPGLTCAQPLGEHAAALAARFLGSPGRNPRYDPSRQGIRRVRGLDEEARSALIRENPDFGEVVCRCRDVTKGEILEAVRRGASTVEGVKRRTGAGMGCCQGSRCAQAVLELMGGADGLL